MRKSTRLGSWALALALLLASPRAQAYCPLATRWRGPVVDVVLHHEAHRRLCIDDAVPCNTIARASLETTVKAAIDEFYDNTGANLRLRYAGLCFTDPPANTRPCDDDDLPPGKIVIRVVPCGPVGHSWPSDTDGDGFTDTSYVAICTPAIFRSYPGSSNVAIQGILLHELSHALGLAHPGDCGDATTSVLNTGNAPHLTFYDALSFQTRYGLRVGETMQIATTNVYTPTTWTSASASAEGNRAMSRFSACDNLTPGGTHVAFVGSSPRWLNLLTHRENGSTALTSIVPSYFPDHVVLSSAHPGVACQDFQRLRIFYAADNGAASQSIQYVESLNGGQSWGPIVLADTATTSLHGGVDATFDPASGLYVYAYRTGSSEIRTKALSPGSRPQGHERVPAPLPGLGACGDPVFPADCWRSSDTPNIACGDPALLGEYNCLMAWADVDWNRTLTYAPAKVVADGAGGHRVLLHSGRSGYSAVHGAPSVALDGSSDFPWRIAYHQGPSRVFTWRKAADPLAFLQSGGSFTFSGAIVTPALGSLRSTGWFPITKTMLFVTTAP